MRILLFIICLVVPYIALAQEEETRDWATKGIKINEVPIYGNRPMKEIGVQQTKFDSVALRENVALSFADVLAFNSSIFVKSFGRATLSTVAFRGTSPSHTQVSWNGMKINNPKTIVRLHPIIVRDMPIIPLMKNTDSVITVVADALPAVRPLGV